MNQSAKLYAAQQAHMDAQKGDGMAPMDDEALDSKRHDRGYNPVDDAERASVSEKLNADSGRYRQGPGPL